jgi:hypothetical protein
MGDEPQPLTKARNTSLVNLESWSTTSKSGKPSPDRRQMSRIMAAASAAVAAARVGTACTLPESRSTWFWIMSNPASVVGSPAMQSSPIIPPRREGSGRGWRSPRGPQCSALVRWHVWQDRTCSATSTSWPTQKARRRTSDPGMQRRRTCARSPGCRGGPPHPARGGTGGRNAPGMPRPSKSGLARLWGHRPCPRAGRAPPPRRA